MCKNSGFRSRIQKSYKKFGIESKNIVIFSESIPNLLPPPCFLGLTQIPQISLISLWVEHLTEALRSFASNGSHRFNEIQQDDYLWEFVLIRGKKSSQQNICVIRGICGFKGNHKLAQIFTNYFGLNGLFLNNFAYLCLYTCPKTFVS